MEKHIDVKEILGRVGYVIKSEKKGDICKALDRSPQAYATWITRDGVPLAPLWDFAQQYKIDFIWLLTGVEVDPHQKLTLLFRDRENALKFNEYLLKIEKGVGLELALNLLKKIAEGEDLPIIPDVLMNEYPLLHNMLGAIRSKDPQAIKNACSLLSDSVDKNMNLNFQGRGLD